jgi:hypothetical protein
VREGLPYPLRRRYYMAAQAPSLEQPQNVCAGRILGDVCERRSPVMRIPSEPSSERYIGILIGGT